MPLAGIPVTYADGEVIFSRGDAAADMFIVRSGSVEIVGWGTEGPISLEVVEPGGVFGEVAIFAPGPRSASAVARGETVCELIDKPTFLEYVQDPVIWAICQRLSERLRRQTKTEEDND